VAGKEPSYAIAGNVNWYNYYGKQYVVPQNIKKKIEIPYDSIIPLLDIYPKEVKTRI